MHLLKIMLKLFLCFNCFVFAVTQWINGQQCENGAICEYDGCITTSSDYLYGCNCITSNTWNLECGYCYKEVAGEFNRIQEYCPPRPCDTACPPGYVIGGWTGCFCFQTFPGAYSPDGISGYLCSAGTYNPNWGASACISCPVGKYGVETGLNWDDGCIECPIGTHWTSVSECTQCVPGKFNPDVGSTMSNACVTCPSGKFQPYHGESECYFCQSGSYASTSAATECLQCDAGTYSHQGSSTCYPGTVLPTGKISLSCTSYTNCLNCFAIDSNFQNVGPISTNFYGCNCQYHQLYQFIYTSEEPWECNTCWGVTQAAYDDYISTGEYYEEVRCYAQCQPGTFGVLTLNSPCTTCVAGTYSSQQGATACITCAQGECKRVREYMLCI